MLTHLRSIPAVLLFAALAFGQAGQVENFDLTGLPPKATNFGEQHLMDMIERHKSGDIQNALEIQQRLAQYYRQKGDLSRARVAEQRAKSAEKGTSSESEGAVPAASSRTRSAVTGEYVCRSMGSRACDTQTTIALHPDGTWGWRYLSGHYRTAGGQVTFEGTGLGSWGPAEIGEDTLTFTSGNQKVIFQKPSSAPASLAGTYVCASAPGGCQTSHAIQIRSDGTWSWGAQGGSYAVVGGQIKFTGLSSGPAGWGLADLGHAALIFRTSYGTSEWKKQP